MISLVWFRYDLRIQDNAALTQAIKQSDKIIPVYIFDSNTSYKWMPGEAQQWWLKKSLAIFRISFPAGKNSAYLSRARS